VPLGNPTLTRIPGGFDVAYPARGGREPNSEHGWFPALASCKRLNPLEQSER
jgi:hypothetical protein